MIMLSYCYIYIFNLFSHFKFFTLSPYIESVSSFFT